MATVYEKAAAETADRIDPTAMMMDPVTIIAIITQVLPIIASCFSRNDSPDPAMAAVQFRAAHESHPNRLRKRLARRVRAEADEPMSKEQSFIMADAIIQQMLETPDEVIQSACNEAPAGL